MKFLNSGVLKFWNFEPLEFQNSGILKFWSPEMLDYCYFAVLETSRFWCFEILEESQMFQRLVVWKFGNIGVSKP